MEGVFLPFLPSSFPSPPFPFPSLPSTTPFLLFPSPLQYDPLKPVRGSEVKVKGIGAVPNAGHRRGAHLPFLGL